MPDRFALLLTLLLPLGLAGCPSGDDDDATANDDDMADDDDATPPLDTDGNGVEDALDCAPNDATIYPGAIDTCDGIDNDCMNDGDADDTAYWLSDAGLGMDLTASLASGTPTAPAAYTLTESGTLTFCPGTLSPALTIDPGISVTIVGAGATDTVLDTAGGGRILDIGLGATVSVSDLTLTGGNDTSTTGQTAVQVGQDANFSIEDARVADCVSFQGGNTTGAIHAGSPGSTITIDNVEFDNNHVHVASIGATSTLTATNSSFENGVNGTYAVGGTGTFTDCTFQSNRVMPWSGSGATLTHDNVTFDDTGNPAAPGGALFGMFGDFTVTLTDVTVTNTHGQVISASSGTATSTLTATDFSTSGSEVSGTGGVGNWMTPGTSTALRATFDGGTASSWGGAFLVDDDGAVIDWTDVTVSNNTANFVGGGGLYTTRSSAVTLTNVSFENNTTVGDGGGAFLQRSAALTNVSFEDNHADGEGGGVYFGPSSGNQATYTWVGGTVSGNTADGKGGGVRGNWSNATFEDVTVSGNTAGTYGGGLYLRRGGTLTDCDIDGNEATANQGGGIYAEGLADLTMVGGSVVSNTAAGNGGGVLSVGTFTATGVDFGDGAQENTPSDVAHGSNNLDYDGVTTATCTGGTCS